MQKENMSMIRKRGSGGVKRIKVKDIFEGNETEPVNRSSTSTTTTHDCKILDFPFVSSDESIHTLYIYDHHSNGCRRAFTDDTDDRHANNEGRKNTVSRFLTALTQQELMHAKNATMVANIQHLQLWHLQLDDWQALADWILARSTTLHDNTRADVRSLELWGSHLTSKGARILRDLLASPRCTLKTLKLTRVSGDLEWIKGLHTNQSITVLEINNLSAPWSDLFATLSRNRTLENVSFYRIVGDDATVTLHDNLNLKHDPRSKCSALKSLFFLFGKGDDESCAISPSFCQELRHQFPGLERLELVTLDRTTLPRDLFQANAPRQLALGSNVHFDPLALAQLIQSGNLETLELQQEHKGDDEDGIARLLTMANLSCLDKLKIVLQHNKNNRAAWDALSRKLARNQGPKSLEVVFSIHESLSNCGNEAVHSFLTSLETNTQIRELSIRFVTSVLYIDVMQHVIRLVGEMSHLKAWYLRVPSRASWRCSGDGDDNKEEGMALCKKWLLQNAFKNHSIQSVYVSWKDLELQDCLEGIMTIRHLLTRKDGISDGIWAHVLGRRKTNQHDYNMTLLLLTEMPWLIQGLGETRTRIIMSRE